jgi:coenzyme F420-0:L-glutamate ligase/coenzyme F420-1:gamma-L-glutamate ligase
VLEILPVHGIGEVPPGADLATLITTAAPWLRDGDLLVVTSKIVSKTEGRLVAVPEEGPERERARQEAVAAETARTVATRGPTRIVATHHGFVMASAGVDASNVERNQLALLPKDPDASARALRTAIAERYGLRVAVIISDTMGRPWRNGLTDVALGAAGVEPLHDHRGRTDPYGNELQLTQTAMADELAAAADLVKGKTNRVPVAVVRGLPALPDGDGPGVVTTLVRDAASDLFALGTAEARAGGLRDAAALTDAGRFSPEPVDPELVRRTVASVVPEAATFQVPDHTPATVRCTVADPIDPVSLVRLGGDLHRLRSALAAEGLAAAVTYPADGSALVRVGWPA